MPGKNGDIMIRTGIYHDMIHQKYHENMMISDSKWGSLGWFMENPLAAARQAGVNDHFHVADGHGTLSNVGAQDHLAPWWHHGGKGFLEFSHGKSDGSSTNGGDHARSTIKCQPSSVRGYRIPFVPSHYWWGYEMQLTIVIHSHSLCCEFHWFLHIPQHIPGPRPVAPSFMVNAGDAQNSPNDDVLCISLQSNISWDSRPYCLLFMIHTWSIVSAILRIIFVDINLVKSNRTKSYQWLNFPPQKSDWTQHSSLHLALRRLPALACFSWPFPAMADEPWVFIRFHDKKPPTNLPFNKVYSADHPLSWRLAAAFPSVGWNAASKSED